MAFSRSRSRFWAGEQYGTKKLGDEREMRQWSDRIAIGGWNRNTKPANTSCTIKACQYVVEIERSPMEDGMRDMVRNNEKAELKW